MGGEGGEGGEGEQTHQGWSSDAPFMGESTPPIVRRMGFSYGVGIILGKKRATKDLEPVIATEFDDLRTLGLTLSVHRTGGLTLLAQSGPDDHRLWNEIDRVNVLTQTFARHFGCRAWSFCGYGGSATEVFISACDAKGEWRWSKKNAAATKALLRDTKLRGPPYEPGMKPFLEVGSPWIEEGEISLFTEFSFTPATPAQLRSVFGRATQAPGALFSQLKHGEFELELITAELGPRMSLEQLRLVEKRSGLSWPPMKLGVDDPFPLPDGTRPRNRVMLRGVESKRAGVKSLVRWGFLFPPADGGTSTWIQLGLAAGPFAEEIEGFDEYEAKEREDEAAQDDQEIFYRALKRRDAAELTRVVKRGRVNPEHGLHKVANDPRCFKALLALIPKAQRQNALDKLFDDLPFDRAVALGADPDSDRAGELLFEAETPRALKALLDNGVNLEVRNWEGQTPLHATDSGAIAKLLVEAGASLTVKDKNGQTPVERFVERLQYAPPTAAELGAVLAMAKHGGARAIKTIKQIVGEWEDLETHQSALQRVRAALSA